MPNWRSPRVAPLRPDQLDPEQATLYEVITGGRRALGPQRFRLRHEDGSLTGPFDLMLRNPAIGRRLSELGEALRYEGGLSDRAREIAILVVGTTRGAAFEWYAHAPIAKAVGMTEDELESIRTGDPAPFADPVEASVYAATRALLAHEHVVEAQFDAWRAALTEGGLVELAAIVGYYDLLATLLQIFAVGVPE